MGGWLSTGCEALELGIALAQLARNVALGMQDAPDVDVIVFFPVDDHEGKSPQEPGAETGYGQLMGVAR